MNVILPRRKFLTGLVSLMAAPAIVKVSSLMPVKNYNRLYTLDDYCADILKPRLDVLYGKLNIGKSITFYHPLYDDSLSPP